MRRYGRGLANLVCGTACAEILVIHLWFWLLASGWRACVDIGKTLVVLSNRRLLKFSVANVITSFDNNPSL
jgi:hypothetical protein